MKRTLMIVGPLAAASLVLAVVFTTLAEGKVTKGDTRPLQTKTLMNHLIKPHCSAIGKGLKADEIDWEALQINAELLNESGHILMADKRCPDGDWAKASKTLSGCSDVLLAKIKA
ncbi:MAG: hypothetical protein N2C14_00330, partial [Planctomycetales bacterium]